MWWNSVCTFCTRFNKLLNYFLMSYLCSENLNHIFRGELLLQPKFTAGTLSVPHTLRLCLAWLATGKWMSCLVILIACSSVSLCAFPLISLFSATKPAALPTRKRGSKVFDSNSRQTLRGTSSARQALMFHTETDGEGREKLLKLYLKRSITFAVMTLTV